jgi:hypothetical protein
LLHTRAFGTEGDGSVADAGSSWSVVLTSTPVHDPEIPRSVGGEGEDLDDLLVRELSLLLLRRGPAATVA